MSGLSCVRLFLLPHAGGSPATYRGWREQLPQWIEAVPLALPGRGERRTTMPPTEWQPLVAEVASDALRHAAPPFAIFGHSMGGLLGFELAHAMREKFGRSPVWLGLSACIAPSRRVFEPKWLHAPREMVIAELRRLGGTPREILESDEMLDVLMPVIRADFHLCGTYAPLSRPPLGCPMLVLGGDQDDISTPRGNLEAWSQETSGLFRLEMIAGGHFFIEEKNREVIALVTQALEAALAAERCARA